MSVLSADGRRLAWPSIHLSSLSWLVFTHFLYRRLCQLSEPSLDLALSYRLFRWKMTEALRHSPGQSWGLRAIGTGASEKLSLPRREITAQDQPLRGRSGLSLAAAPELKGASEIELPSEHSSQSPASPFRPGFSLDGDPRPFSLGSCGVLATLPDHGHPTRSTQRLGARAASKAMPRRFSQETPNKVQYLRKRPHTFK